METRQAQKRFQILAVNTRAYPVCHLRHCKFFSRIQKRFKIHAVEDLLDRKRVVSLLPSRDSFGNSLIETVGKLPVFFALDRQHELIGVDVAESRQQIEAALFARRRQKLAFQQRFDVMHVVDQPQQRNEPAVGNERSDLGVAVLEL